jgi:catechol 2,3-dioxygenase-like lactoylglutathione lyase family enzyme
MTVKHMDNVGIAVEDLDAAIEFFTELGLDLEGRAQSKERGQMASLDCETCASRWP